MANNTNLSYPSAFYQQFIDKNGKPLVCGKLYTYLAGSTTSVVTYKTIGGGTESSNRNTNPIILDMAGMAKLVISTDIAYKFVLFDKNNVKIDEWDDVTAGGSEGGGSSNVYVEGTNGEIDVREESTGLIRRFIVSLSDSVKNSISELYSSVNDIINAISNKKDKQQPVTALGSPTKVPVSILQNANGALDVEFDDIAFPDWTTAINNAVSNCEKTSNKKNSVTGYESSTTAYPSIKAVVDFVNSIMQNLGGKLITDNGNPFSDSADLPSTTPYQGVNISDKDYAYVQGIGFAERWSASVSGSDVTWVQEYSINIPVFTPAQQAAIDSTATATKINNYDLHIANTSIHVTSTEKNTWNAKQNAISDLAEIRSGAAAGATALQPSGNGSNVTSTFTAASSRTNISSGEKLSTIFGKIAKWFADLKSVAFSGSYNDLSNTPTIPVVNNGKLNIRQNGTLIGEFYANDSSTKNVDIVTPTKTSDLNNDSGFLTEVTDDDIDGTISDLHIASASEWNEKLSPSGNGSNLTAVFSEAGTRSNINSGESFSTILGKIKKFFSDLKSVAFTGNYSDLSGTPTIPAAANNGILTIKQNGTSKGTFSANQSNNTEINVTDTTYESKNAASGGSELSLVTTGEKFTWNGKQNSLPYSGGKYGINISGSAAELEKVSLGQVDTLPISQIVSSSFKVGTFLLKGDNYGGQPYVFGNVTIPNNQLYRFSVSGEGANYCVITLEPSTGGASSPFNIFKILVDNGSEREDKVMKVVRVPYGTKTSEIGNSETPVYVDVSGEIKACDTSKYYMRWNDTTPQWITIGTDAAVRLWYAKNYCVNYANFSLTNSHPSLCYIVCTLPALTSNEIYDLSIEITITGNGSSIQGGTAIFLIDSENSDFTILSEYAPDGIGGFLNIPQNRIALPSNGKSVKYKVYVSGHAYRVARLA